MVFVEQFWIQNHVTVLPSMLLRLATRHLLLVLTSSSRLLMSVYLM
jgi:hypothetical protein